LISSHMLHGAGIWNPTFALVQNHSQSFFCFYIPAPWVAYGLYSHFVPLYSL
jgi:hypothetical protein